MPAERSTTRKTAERSSSKRSSDAEKNTDTTLDPRLSRKILALAREQQRDEFDRAATSGTSTDHTLPTKFDNDRSSSDEDEDELVQFDDDDFESRIDYLAQIDEREQRVLEEFCSREPQRQATLADIILQKIALAEDTDYVPGGINPKIAAVYSRVGLLLSRYKSGKLPKTFKIVPQLANWEEVLYITAPENWTANAVYAATKLFVSTKPHTAQRFFSFVLLDRVRDDIAETKKLNVHLYMALKRALYKPAAFFKGILFPLCESGTCTLREAAILGSVISKVSIPLLHSAAALLKLAEMEYTGPNSVFIRILLDKRYALPYKVVDGLVFHFIRFRSDARRMPVLWQQSLLVFAQRYKADVTPDQKDALLQLVTAKYHEGITEEIRRELSAARCRSEIMAEGGDVAMQ